MPNLDMNYGWYIRLFTISWSFFGMWNHWTRFSNPHYDRFVWHRNEPSVAVADHYVLLVISGGIKFHLFYLFYCIRIMKNITWTSSGLCRSCFFHLLGGHFLQSTIELFSNFLCSLIYFNGRPGINTSIL